MNMEGISHLNKDELEVFKKIVDSVNKTSGKLKRCNIDLKNGDSQSVFRIMDALDYYGYKTNLERANGEVIINVEKRA